MSGDCGPRGDVEAKGVGGGRVVVLVRAGVGFRDKGRVGEEDGEDDVAGGEDGERVAVLAGHVLSPEEGDELGRATSPGRVEGVAVAARSESEGRRRKVGEVDAGPESEVVGLEGWVDGDAAEARVAFRARVSVEGAKRTALA